MCHHPRVSASVTQDPPHAGQHVHISLSCVDCGAPLVFEGLLERPHRFTLSPDGTSICVQIAARDRPVQLHPHPALRPH